MRCVKANKDVTLPVHGSDAELFQTVKRGAIGVLDKDTELYVFKKDDVTGAVTDGLPAFDKSVIAQHTTDFDPVENAGTPVAPPATDGGAKPKMTKLVLTDEAWREYVWKDPASGKMVMKRFENPEAVYFYNGCTTHRVITKRDGKEVGVLVPAIGVHGCTVTWGPKDGHPIVIA